MRKKLLNKVLFSIFLVSVVWDVFGVPARFDVPQSAERRRRGNIVRGDSSIVRLDSSSTVRGAVLPDSMSRGGDIVSESDTLPRDTTKKKFLDAPIFGTNKDTLIYDVVNKLIYIHGEGDVKYDNMGIKAEYMRLDVQNKLVRAQGKSINVVEASQKKTSLTPKAAKPITDSSEMIYIRPVFTEGQTEYEIDTIDYNMDSQKAFIKGVDTKEGEGFLFGGEIKKMKDNVVHMHNGRYTTCDADCKHFYLQMTKGTVVPGKKTVFGPSYLVFEDVPIYFLGLPFGFFPQVSDRNSGFIIPEIGEEVVKGFFLRNGGYYFVINDNVDVKATAGIYTLGSWQANLASNYFKRYKFGGSFQFDYASDVIGEVGSTDYVNTKNMRIMWSHRQDPKASPGSTFSASVNFSTSSYNKYNAENLQDYINGQTNSSIAYQKTWMGTPFSLTVNGQLSQITRDTVYSFNLPSINFNVNRINPFKRKNQVGQERWYEKISFTYNMQFQNNTGTVKERDLFQEKMFNNMQFGVKHTIPVSASFNLFQYLNITPAVNYNERWYFRRINKGWSEEKNLVVNTDTTRGFYRVAEYNANLSFTTNLYGMYTFGKRQDVKLRHVLTPRFSFGFSPGFEQYYETIETKPGQTQIYSPYGSELYGVPSRNKSANLSFGLDNTLEMKVPSSTDSTGEKKIKLLDALNISSAYDFVRDSLNLDPFTVNLRTTVANGKLAIQVGSTFDPYQVDERGNRINKFQIKKKGLARLTSLNFSFGYSFQSRQSNNNSNQSAINNPTNNNNTQTYLNQQGHDAGNDFFSQSSAQLSQVERARMAATQYYDFNIPWSLSFNYVFAYTNSGSNINRTNSVTFNGSVNVTSKWGVSFGAGYDFMMNKLTPGSIQITRDLHCWQMSFSWIPVGFRQSWQFSIRAKASMLSDLLKWDKNNSFYDNNYMR